jgi:hypothetical protein
LSNRTASCEVWDLTPPPRPPHSRLYSLEPVGSATAECESLTGYIARLAEAHSIYPRVLVTFEMGPMLGLSPDHHLAASTAFSSIYSRDIRQLNGTRMTARTAVQALEVLTKRSDLTSLTWLNWAEGLPVRGLLRHYRVWCPECYEAWRKAGQVIYEPLLWTLRDVVMCSRHRRLLQGKCPHPDCGVEKLPLLASHSRPGHCSQCGGWLGKAHPDIQSRRLSKNELVWHSWVNEVVGDLLAHSAEAICHRHNVAQAIRASVQRLAQGSVRKLASAWGVPKPTLEFWRRGGQFPVLKRLLQICYRLNTTPRQVFAKGAAAVTVSHTRELPWSEPWASSTLPVRPLDVEQMRQTLENVLAADLSDPPSMRGLADHLGYAPTRLVYHFPDLCHAISARYKAHIQAGRRKKIRQGCEEIRQIAAQLHAQGIYPSAGRIARQLHQPGFILQHHARTAWHAALRELGWES